MKLRLLLFSQCNRHCQKCCNKDWDLAALPVCQSYSAFEKIILTGGEPMLRPDIIKGVVADIRAKTGAPIYIYTAKADDAAALLDILDVADGITLTLHSRKDVAPFKAFDAAMKERGLDNKSLRLNVFYGISLRGVDTSAWSVKKGIRWIENCPLPQDEVFMRLDSHALEKYPPLPDQGKRGQGLAQHSL